MTERDLRHLGGTALAILLLSGAAATLSASPVVPSTSLAADAFYPFPTLFITANGQSPGSGYVGQPIVISATFSAGSGDSLAGTAINDNSGNLWCGTGNTCTASMWTQYPIGSKTYTFTPTASGIYIFYPAAKTAQYPFWSSWSQWLLVTVSLPCTNGQGAAGMCTSCNSSYVLSGGYCQPQCPNGQGIAGACTSCNSGYVLYGGSCLLPMGTITTPLAASPARVRPGGSATLSWATSYMTSCSLKNDSGATISTQTTSSGTPVGPVTTPTAYTLSCTDGAKTYTSSMVLTLLPSFQEI